MEGPEPEKTHGIYVTRQARLVKCLKYIVISIYNTPTTPAFLLQYTSLEYKFLLKI